MPCCAGWSRRACRPGGGDRLRRAAGRPMTEANRATPAEQPESVRNEQVLSRELSSVQQTTMAIGGAIGTGLFLSTGLSVGVAGPSVIASYVIVAAISLLLGRAR